MIRLITDLPVNPFEDNIVFEPREAEPATPGLNEKPLARLLELFSQLEAEPMPRRRALKLKAQLVASAEPGYGKSHLIGRLFQALASRATLVYLRPFQDARSAWRSILLKLAQELSRPGAEPGTRTQLDGLAAGLISGLLLALIGRGKLQEPPDGFWSNRLRRHPLAALGFGEPAEAVAEGDLAEWLRAAIKDGGPLLEALEREAGTSGLTLHAPAGAWVRTLFAYGAGRPHGPERAAALRWIKGENLAEDEAALLNLRPADAAAPPGEEETAGARNEAAWRRIQDLFALAGYYRPFLLCFDQTELFTGDPALAGEFGAVIECLVSHGVNFLAVVTTNLSPWRDNILPHIQTALRARFSDPLELAGINAGQARALARRRLEGCGLAEDEVNRFFEPPWFENYFRESPVESARRFLDRCKKRCAQLGGSTSSPPPTLEEYFARSRRGLEAKPPVFDMDVLQWAIGPDAVDGAKLGVTTEPFGDPPGYGKMLWRRPKPAPERQIHFGIEDDSDGRRWSRILDHITVQAAEQEMQGIIVCYIFLRTPDQERLPRPTWPVVGARIKQATDRGTFSLLVIEKAQLAALHAAHELYAHTLAGNTPFRVEEARRFVRERLEPWHRGLMLG